MSRSIGLGLAYLLLCAAPAPARATPPDTHTLRQMLSGYEHTPSADELRRLGPGTLDALVALYDLPDSPLYIRLRAVRAASYFSAPASRAFLVRVASRDESDLLVAEAITGLGRAFGHGAIEDVRPYLASPRPQVRAAAARCLGRMGTATARAALRRQLRRERHAHCRRVLLRALADASSR